jgi:rubredoxin
MGEPDLTPVSPAWGDRSQVPPDARLECKICWWVYDPAEGDAVWQIPPGTAFADLPVHWRCPQCDAEASKFLLLTE